MIKVRKVSKTFDEIEAVKDTTLTIQDANVFGLLGTNGAGKSTLLRMMSGILQPDEGMITIDGDPVWDNPDSKAKFFYISDDQFYFGNGTPEDLGEFYSLFYKDFDIDRYKELLKTFNLDAGRKINTFSKGMKKQLSILVGIACKVPYILCDETFDGLDPVMRQGIKSLFAREIDERGLTPVIASHNLRELEDICDHIGLLHKGGVLLSKDLEDLKCNLTKVQCVLDPVYDEDLKKRMNLLHFERRGKLLTLTARGKAEEILARINEYDPVFCEALPLSLEEIFISETEVAGYDIRNLISEERR
ncbi:MAG: ABC transporter ATP-binding protein [Eubacterium sp.]|nr:ABC transporter ATP-binding protein [Eubacterium sp.]